MFLRIDKLPFQLPQSTQVDPESAAAVQELLGGRFGEMSTFNNYFTRSIGAIWNGESPDGGQCEVVDAPPQTAAPHIDLAGIGSAFAPDYHPQEIFEMAQKLYRSAR
jgi:Mn-containing catalase